MTTPGLDELFRRAVDLNLRYYGAVGKLAADYLRDLANVVGNLPQQPASGSHSTSAAQLLFEAGLGEIASGAFLVENSLPQDVQGSVVASPLSDPAGRQSQPKVAFDPATIALKRGERALVKATLVITPELEAGVRYTGDFHMPQLPGTRIPVVVRRRP